MKKPILFAVLILFGTLTFACSSGDSTNTPDPSATPQPSQNTDQVEVMRTVALDFLNAWYAKDYGTMSELIDPRVTAPDVTAKPGYVPVKNLCSFANANCFQYQNGSDHLIPVEWSQVELCDRTDGRGNTIPSFPCEESEITNITDTAECRDATPADAANGYGKRCEYSFRFAEREVGSEGEFADQGHCVVVQLAEPGPIVTETYSLTTCNNY